MSQEDSSKWCKAVWPVWFHFLLVLLALSLIAHLLPFRHNTMAIGIAVDILGCTGSLEERAATLNKIIQVAVELKDSMGDLYSFSAIMKALEMPQVNFHLLCAALWAWVYLMPCKVVFKSMPGKPQVTLVNSKGKSCLSESCFDQGANKSRVASFWLCF